MWDDAVQMQGRHTKRKWKTAGFLLLLAVLTTAEAWVSVHPELPGAVKSALVRTLDHGPQNRWVPGEETPETAFFLEGQICTLKGQRLQCWDLSGQAGATWTVPLEAPQTIRSEKWAAFYESKGRQLYLLGRELTEISVPGSIYAAALSDRGQSAVITQGSGCLTRTVRYDSSGREVGEISLTDRAMVLLTYLRGTDTLAACCVTNTGDWVLCFDDGGHTIEITLDASLVYDLRPWGQVVMLWTDRGLAAYTPQEGLVQEVRLGSQEMIAWDSSGFGAAAVWRAGQCVLLTITEGGVKEVALTEAPRALSVCGNSLAILDSQALLLYDRNSALLRTESQGALARSVQAVDGGAILFGETGFFRAMNQ